MAVRILRIRFSNISDPLPEVCSAFRHFRGGNEVTFRRSSCGPYDGALPTQLSPILSAFNTAKDLDLAERLGSGKSRRQNARKIPHRAVAQFRDEAIAGSDRP